MITTLFFTLLLSLGATGEEPVSKEKKIIRYKKHTDIDLTGTSVEGKARTPEIFYIFQRKRSKGHDAVALPSKFVEHQTATVQVLEQSMGD